MKVSRAQKISGWFSQTVVALCCLTSLNALGAAFKASDLFKPNHLMEVDITMSPANWEALRSESDRSNGGFGRMFGGAPSTEKRFHYFQGDITIDGVRIPTVGLRTKGFIGSLNPNRPSIKVKFDEYVDQAPIEGLDRLTLNNNNQDGSLCSQFLTYHLFNKVGIPAPRVSFAKVTVNGEYLGVYSHVESVRSPFLNTHFGDDSGEFYEGTIADFYPGAVNNIEAKNKTTEKDRSRAAALAELLESETTFDLAKVEQAVNVDAFLRFWAMESLLGFWDGYTNNQNNYFAYANPQDDHRFHFMPWGADGAFSEGRGPFGRGEENSPVSVYSTGMLNHRLYQAQGIPERYRQTMLSILKDVWSEEELLKEVDRIRALTKDHLHEEQRRGGGGFGRGGFGRGNDNNSSQDAAERGAEQLKRFVNNRRALVEAELSRWPVAISGEPRIPNYSVKVGEINGSFLTTWQGERIEQLNDQGSAKLEITLNDTQLELSKMAVLGQPEQPMRGWGRGGPPGMGGRNENRPANPTLRFEGVEKSTGKLVTMDLVIEKEAFAAGKKKIPFNGTLGLNDPNQQEEGGFDFRRFMDRKSLQGSLKLSQAGTLENDTIEGTLKLEIWENRGGFGGGPGGGGRPGRRGGR